MHKTVADNNTYVLAHAVIIKHVGLRVNSCRLFSNISFLTEFYAAIAATINLCAATEPALPLIGPFFPIQMASNHNLIGGDKIQHSQA